MIGRFSFIVALRYFLAKKNEKFVSIISGISIAGITIGVGALIIVMSVMNGFHIQLTSNIKAAKGDILVEPIDEVISDSIKTISIIKKQNFVKKVFPMISGQALALGKNTNTGVLVRGIDLLFLKDKKEIIKNVKEGSFKNYVGTNVVALGTELAYNLGVSIGSKIKILSPNIISTAFGTMPRFKEFTVVAVFSSGLYDYDSAIVIMPISAAQKLFLLKSNINLIEINVYNPEFAFSNAKCLQKELVGYNVRVSSWLENNEQLLNALKIERVTMFTILSLIIIVAAFNIIASLFMIVKDKTKDIAILKTMGASLNQIMLIFVINGLFIGIIGTFLGTLIGILISYNIDNIRLFLERFSDVKIFDPAIYFLYNLPSVSRIFDIVVVDLVSLVLSLIATIYPSFKAARIDPVESMRNE